jgi:hypothetical protein
MREEKAMPQIVTGDHVVILCTNLSCTANQRVEGEGVLATSREAQRRGWRTLARGNRLYWFCKECARAARRAKP